MTAVSSWSLFVKQTRGLLKGGLTEQTRPGTAFLNCSRQGIGAIGLIWSPGRRSQADMGPYWPDFQNRITTRLLRNTGIDSENRKRGQRRKNVVIIFLQIISSPVNLLKQ